MLGNLVSLKRWQWLVISMLVGLAAGYAARPMSSDLRGDYGESRNSQKELEIALVSETGGHRWLKDVVVHRQSVADPSGGARNEWVVSGLYSAEAVRRDATQLHYKPTFYVVPEPYRPIMNVSDLRPAAAGARFEKLSSPTVVDFLQLLADTSGLQFTHAWWRTYARATWLSACVLFLGVLFPTAIDLIYFGRLLRPRQEKGTRLTPSPTVVSQARPELSAQDRARLEDLDAALEAGLKAGAAPATATAAPLTPAAPVPKLNAEPQTATVAASQEARAYGAKPDDFYPTEQKAKVPTVKPRS